MNTHQRPVFRSIRVRLLLGMLLLIVPLIGFLFYENHYAMNVVRNQVANSMASTSALYIDQIDQRLGEVERYLLKTAAFESDLAYLDYPASDQVNALYPLAKTRLTDKLDTDYANGYQASVDLFFIYSAVNEDLITSRIPGDTYDERKTLAYGILDLMGDIVRSRAAPENKWLTLRIDGRYYLYHVTKTGNAYVGGIVETAKLMMPLSFLELGQIGKPFLLTEAGEPMNDTGYLAENGIRLNLNPAVHQSAGQSETYLNVTRTSSKGAFSLLVLIPESAILERLPDLQVATALIVIGALILLPAVYMFLRKVILKPIYRIISAMRKVRDGYLDDRINRSSTAYEFELMNDMFNSMVSQIENLKISVYEEKLLNQSAELKHLQLQINPHFFLNSLNIIHSFAQLRNFELIQEMSQYLVQYLRFMFRSNLRFVKISDEIEHTGNYLRIQAMRFPDHFMYRLEAEDALLDALIPPLTIQTFVENTIKHAVTMEERIVLGIRIARVDEAGTARVKIEISDSGQGFPASVLPQLNADTPHVSEGGERIGIWNVRRRLRLLYQEGAQLRLSNRTEGGAKVEICIPLQYEERETG